MNNQSFYSHLDKSLFHSGPSGVIVRSADIIVDLSTGKSDYALREKSNVERNNLVGLWVNAPQATPQPATETQTIVSRPVFNAAYLTLRVETNEVIERIPLRRIEECNLQGKPYYVSIGEKVNLSESKIYIANSASITANEVIELTADYVIPRTR